MFLQAILGHTEDAMTEIKDHIYIISAEILSKSETNSADAGEENDVVILEKFTTFCYGATLMGYTMGYNNHGMIYSVNTIFPTVNTTGTRTNNTLQTKTLFIYSFMIMHVENFKIIKISFHTIYTYCNNNGND